SASPVEAPGSHSFLPEGGKARAPSGPRLASFSLLLSRVIPLPPSTLSSFNSSLFFFLFFSGSESIGVFPHLARNRIASRAADVKSVGLMSRFLILLALAIGTGGCFHVRVSMDPVEVHATVDVNVKIDQALNNFFDDLDAKSKTLDAS
ncbi:MAG: hypothetical protein LBK99_03265, partial [Opitutaceae bacterium]|nr:hypothetical protein [Opitutaceae bacterium]